MIELPREAAEFFPYKNVRPYQDEFVKTVYEAVKNRSSAIVEGSNGLGKTVAVLCECLPSAEEEKLKILYVARTHRQHDRVIEELKAISAKNKVSGVSVRGRHEMCLNQFVKDNAQDSRAVMEICELARALGDFMLRWLETSEDEPFVHSLRKYKSRRGFETARLEIVALDPSRITEPVFSTVHSNIIVPGTLQPLEAFVKMTKLPENTVQKVVPAPFPKEHILPLVCKRARQKNP